MQKVTPFGTDAAAPLPAEPPVSILLFILEQLAGRRGRGGRRGAVGVEDPGFVQFEVERRVVHAGNQVNDAIRRLARHRVAERRREGGLGLMRERFGQCAAPPGPAVVIRQSHKRGSLRKVGRPLSLEVLAIRGKKQSAACEANQGRALVASQRGERTPGHIPALPAVPGERLRHIAVDAGAFPSQAEERSVPGV